MTVPPPLLLLLILSVSLLLHDHRNNKPGKRPLVFLQHGVTLASDCYTILNANESVAYIMADAGTAPHSLDKHNVLLIYML